MDLFLEIKPVADFSASCYWRLTRMAGLAADYALPKVRRFVRKRGQSAEEALGVFTRSRPGVAACSQVGFI